MPAHPVSSCSNQVLVGEGKEKRSNVRTSFGFWPEPDDVTARIQVGWVAGQGTVLNPGRERGAYQHPQHAGAIVQTNVVALLASASCKRLCPRSRGAGAHPPHAGHPRAIWRGTLHIKLPARPEVRCTQRPRHGRQRLPAGPPQHSRAGQRRLPEARRRAGLRPRQGRPQLRRPRGDLHHLCVPRCCAAARCLWLPCFRGCAGCRGSCFVPARAGEHCHAMPSLPVPVGATPPCPHARCAAVCCPADLASPNKGGTTAFPEAELTKQAMGAEHRPGTDPDEWYCRPVAL